MGICVKELLSYWMHRAKMPECTWTMLETGHTGLIAFESMSDLLFVSADARFESRVCKPYIEVHDIPLASWANHRNTLANIVIVELTAFDELETMAGIKTIRSAFFESTHSNREPSHIRLFENLSENCRAYP